MGRPKDLPPEKAYEHGTRARYVAGCRCKPCTKSNLTAYHARQERAKKAAMLVGGMSRTKTHCIGVNRNPCPRNTKLRIDSTGNICAHCRGLLVWNGSVSAEKARTHLLALSEQGVGRRAVHDKAGVSATVVADVRTGKKKMIRANTEKKILSVKGTDFADGALVDARPVWGKIRSLMKNHGYTKAAISGLIGQGGLALQLGKGRMTAASARQIDALYELANRKYPDICTKCGNSHEPANRRRLITRMYLEGLTANEIKKAWPCFYSSDYTDKASERRFYRDIKTIKERLRKEGESNPQGL